MKPERIWACWSHSQQCFHVEEEAEGIETNLEAFWKNTPLDYIVLGVFSDREKADAFIRTIDLNWKRSAV